MGTREVREVDSRQRVLLDVMSYQMPEAQTDASYSVPFLYRVLWGHRSDQVVRGGSMMYSCVASRRVTTAKPWGHWMRRLETSSLAHYSGCFQIAVWQMG